MINNKNFNLIQAYRPNTCVYKVFNSTDKMQYAHHSYICKFKDKYIVMFSSGREHEDDVGQRAVITFSRDLLSWTNPLKLEITNNPKSVDTACGFFVFNDKLYVYVGTYCYSDAFIKPDGSRIFEDKGHKNTKLYVLVSDDGEHFSAPIFTGLNMIPNMPPKLLSNGQVVICGNFLMPVNRDFGKNINAWEIYGINTNIKTDDSETFYSASEQMGIETNVCECDLYQSNNGLFISLFRSQKKEFFGYLYSSVSRDLKSWGIPSKTEFTNDTSKFCVGKLSDGRFFYVGNPLVGGQRCPLVLSLSTDGENFTEHFVLGEEKPPIKFKGFAKFGAYGYPYALEDNGYFYAVYSINKEDVAITAVKIKDLY